VCHGRTGAGDGMIVQRGYKQPPTYHSERLRGVPIGHFFEVITYGYATMPAYASQVSVEDRWAIAAYIRALQLSQFATLDDVPAASRQQLEGTLTP
jgi:mono/diheme cytochrome c family protein